MSNSHYAYDHQPFLDGRGLPPLLRELASNSGQSNRTIDAALRSVPLPDGLMTRLGHLIVTMPDESADYVDWLGC
jgi:hypothetical protein